MLRCARLARLPDMLKALRRYLSGRAAPAAAAVQKAPVDVRSLLDAPARALAQGRTDEAERLLDAVLKLHHDLPEAHLLRGKIHHRRGEREEARDSFILASHFAPQSWQPQLDLGLLELEAGRVHEAIACFATALALGAVDARVHNALGAAHLRNQKIDEALAQFRRALDLEPEFAEAHSNLGYVLFRETEAFDEGARHIEKAVALEPNNPVALCNWAMVLQQRGRMGEALALFDRLLAADPAFSEARVNRALMLLTRGDFAAGWRDYEERKLVWNRAITQDVPAPEWNGSDLSGSTIVVLAEQGLGDEIMFASCLPQVVAHADRCVVECNPKLARLFARSFPQAAVVGKGAWRDALAPGDRLADWCVAIGSLPAFLRNTLVDFPARRAYLHADPARVAYWRERLAALPGRLKIGLSWRGGLSATRSTLRSIPLALWSDVLQCPDAEFISLQYSDCTEEIEQVRNAGHSVHAWREAIDDYDETAALVSALDLVVSVQTAVVHLAGALGTPVWALIPQTPEWRYGHEGDAMPWYPSVRLIRQQSGDDWGPVLRSVSAGLRTRARVGD